MDLFNVRISQQSIELATAVLQSGWINNGLSVQKFEEHLALLGLSNPVAVNSCTSALHLALICENIGPGDEVILPPQTFIATGVAILMTGATPVFSDIDPYTGNLDPNKIKITNKTKAIIPVHWAGLPCDVPAFSQISQQYGIPIIEDAAHALGSSIEGQIIGSISKYTCFSFQAIKLLTSGDGGVVCTTDLDKKQELIRRRWFGIDKNVKTGYKRDYVASELGFKYNMNDITAAIGLGNINDINIRICRRREIACKYREAFIDVPGLRMLRSPAGYAHAYWVFTILVDRKDEFVKQMQKYNIPVSMIDCRIDKNPVFGGITPGLVGQEEFENHQIAIPVHDDLTDDDVNLIIDIITKGW